MHANSGAKRRSPLGRGVILTVGAAAEAPLKELNVQMIGNSELLDHRDVPAYLGGHVTVGTLSQWRFKGIGPRYIKIGRRPLYRRSDLDSWLAAQVVETNGAGPIR